MSYFVAFIVAERAQHKQIPTIIIIKTHVLLMRQTGTHSTGNNIYPYIHYDCRYLPSLGLLRVPSVSVFSHIVCICCASGWRCFVFCLFARVVSKLLLCIELSRPPYYVEYCIVAQWRAGRREVSGFFPWWNNYSFRIHFFAGARRWVWIRCTAKWAEMLGAFSLRKLTPQIDKPGDVHGLLTDFTALQFRWERRSLRSSSASLIKRERFKTNVIPCSLSYDI